MQFSLHLNMAQQCMDLMEKKKLLLTANVEQVCACVLIVPDKDTKPSPELRNRLGSGRQSPKDACRRDGPSSGRYCCLVRSLN